MTPIPINIAVEVLLSEAVAGRLLRDSGRPFSVGVTYNRGGNGYLRKTAPGWNTAARGVPFFLLTDLDAVACVPELIGSWIPGSVHPNLIFRVAVREVESWLLADRINLSTFFGISRAVIPPTPDAILDPKAALVDLARRSRLRSIRERVVPKPRSTAKQGRDYNACLGEFVANLWDPTGASLNSESLSRCRAHLASFSPMW